MSGISAYGTLLGVSTGMSSLSLTTMPSTWDYIGQLTNISGPSVAVDSIDVTSHDSTGGYRQFVAGLIDGGDLSLEGNLLTAGAGDELLDLAETRENICFYVKFPTAAGSTGWAWLFAGAVNGLETQAPHDGKIGFTASIKLTEQPFMTSTYTTA
jgi:predicted secreted protein